ncbi:unnamed protein product, partial [Amoebophrya sp. A120]
HYYGFHKYGGDRPTEAEREHQAARRSSTASAGSSEATPQSTSRTSSQESLRQSSESGSCQGNLNAVGVATRVNCSIDGFLELPAMSEEMSSSSVAADVDTWRSDLGGYKLRNLFVW